MRIIITLILLTALGLAIVSLTGAWTTQAGEPEERPPVVPVGKETARAGCLFENGFNICDYGEARLKDAYLRYQDYLGRPVAGFDARCQTFQLGRLCYNPANPDDWTIEFDNLGLLDLQANGYRPAPGAMPHPAVRDWLLTAAEVNVDPWRIAGRILSAPVCDAGQCRQWTDKTLFLFPERATSHNQVRRAPLGTWSIHPAVVDVESSTERSVPLIPLLGAAGLGLVGILLLIRARGTSAQRSVTI